MSERPLPPRPEPPERAAPPARPERSEHRWLRATALPALALVLAAGVLGAQVASGGGDFTPLQPADACTERPVTAQSEGIEGLTEVLVLRGVRNAACTLGVTREALTLQIAQQSEPNDQQVDALRGGLRKAVGELAADDALPPPSALLDEALDGADLNGLLKRALRALPDGLVDGALDTEDVLLRSVDELDLRSVLSDLNDTGALNDEVERAVTQSVREALVDRVRNLI